MKTSKSNKEKTMILAVDPSSDKTIGLALKKFINGRSTAMTFFTGDLFQCINWINQNCILNQTIAVVENANLNSAVFGAWDQMKRSIVRNNFAEMKSVFSRLIKHAQRIGRMKNASELIITLFEQQCVPVIEVAPSSRRKAYRETKDKKKIRLNVMTLNMPTKTNREQFAILTGHVGTTSIDARDAGTMIHDKTINWCLLQLQKQIQLS